MRRNLCEGKCSRVGGQSNPWGADEEAREAKPKKKKNKNKKKGKK